jgi:hypothetical protein
MFSAVLWDELCFVRAQLSPTAIVLGFGAAMAGLMVFTGWQDAS